MISGEFLVNVSSYGFQHDGFVAALASGRYAFGWVSDSVPENIRARVFHADGSAVADEVAVNETLHDNQEYPMLAGLTGGRFAVAWQDYNDLGYGNVRLRVFDSDGDFASGETLLGATTRDITSLGAVSALPSGSFLVSYGTQHKLTYYSNGARIQVIDNAGSGLVPETRVDSSGMTSGAVRSAALAGGNTVVVWRVYQVGPADGPYQTRAQIVDTVGRAVGDEFVIHDASRFDRADFELGGLPDGGFVVTWSDESGRLGDTDGAAVYAQTWNADGSARSLVFQVNTTEKLSQSNPAVTVLDDGRFLIAWVDGPYMKNDIKAQLFDKDGAKVGTELTVNDTTIANQDDPTLATLADGRVIAGWTDWGQAGGVDFNDRVNILGKFLDFRTTPLALVGSSLGDEWIGTGFDDRMNGGLGRDVLWGQSGADTLIGRSERDKLYGGAGMDALRGGTQNDTLRGGSGRDLLDGGGGNDSLKGGTQADRFVFSGMFGDDRIADFETAGRLEKIDISAVRSIQSFRDLTSNHLREVGGNAVIDDGQGNTITLDGVAVADLSANDFVF